MHLENLSNLYGALEASQSIEDGTNKKDALNNFTKRVQGSIKKTNTKKPH